jgi:hypothetical protein
MGPTRRKGSRAAVRFTADRPFRWLSQAEAPQGEAFPTMSHLGFAMNPLDGLFAESTHGK